MSSITYHQPDGTASTIEFDKPDYLMQVALKNNVPGIIGECGGQAMCATCHVYVHDEFLGQLPEISEEEEEMLDFTASERDEQRSRLGCQIKVGAEVKRLEVDVPKAQV